MKLPWGQDDLIRKVVEANPRTIVVLFGTMVEMGDWLERVPAVLQAWYPGMEGGNALARVLFGDVNPSGKLPCTIPKVLADSPAHALGAYPGVTGTVTYAEGLLVGYRWFDTKGVEPRFPFGHGLSYTTFRYANLRLTPGTGTNGAVVTAEFTVENTGSRAGAEVAQLYVEPVKPGVERPLQELKGFEKVHLAPGASRTVRLPLDASAFAYFDPARRGWVANAGGYVLRVGASSRDIRLTAPFELARTVVLPP
jgi:beta-glucosidase